MSYHPKQRGDHTWDLVVAYHKCPVCGFIFENRDEYMYRLGSYIKECQCPRCSHSFTLKKCVKPRFGPFFWGRGSCRNRVGF